MLKYSRHQLPKVSVRIKSNIILAGALIILGIIIIVGGLKYTFDLIVKPPREYTDTFAIGGATAICLGLAPLIYGIATFRDEILHRKPREVKEGDEERKV